MLERIDGYAEKEAVNRPEAIRRLVEKALEDDEAG